MNVKQVAKNKSIIAAIVAMISVLYTAETAYAGPCRTPCSDRVTDWFKTPDGAFRCFDDGYYFTSIYGFQMEVTWDKNGCFLSRETYFIDDRNALTSAILEEGFSDCCGGVPILKTFFGSDGKTVTKVEKFGKDGCLTETDAFVYDDKGQLKDEIISDQYYNYNCLVISPEPTPVAGRVTHKTPAVFVTGPGPVPIPQQKTTEISLYDRDGHLVSVTTFDDQGRAKRSDARASSAPSGQSEVPVSSVTNGSSTTQISTYDGKGHLVSVTTLDDQGRVKRSDARPQFTPSGQAGGTGRVVTGVNPFIDQSNPSIIWQNPATGGTAGVAPESGSQTGVSNKWKISHPGSSITGGDSVSGGTAGVAGPGTETAHGSTAGVAGTAPVAMPTDASQREPMKSPTPAGRHLRKRLTVPITAGSPAPAPTPSGHGGGGHGGSVGSATGATAGVVGPGDNSSSGGNSASGGTAGVAGSSSGQAGAGNKRKIIWQKSSSAATNTGSSAAGNSATGGTAGVAGAGTTTGSSGSASTRRKSQSKRSVSPSSNANVQGSSQSGGNVHPTPTPTSRKKKPGTEVQNEH
jgi:YD repeat-containing protein